MNAVETKAQTAAQEADAPRRICFVCTGNTCRSPMAEAMANARAEQLALPLEAFSRGLSVCPGDPISPFALAALEEAGVPALPHHDYHSHRARPLTAEDAESFDLLIGLTRRHAMAMLLQFPHLAPRITALQADIPDPYGGDPDTYRLCLRAIQGAIRPLLAGEEETK